MCQAYYTGKLVGLHDGKIVPVHGTPSWLEIIVMVSDLASSQLLLSLSLIYDLIFMTHPGFRFLHKL